MIMVSRREIRINVQGSAHGIHFRQPPVKPEQKFIIYRNECLRIGKIKYDLIGGDVDDKWHPFRLQGTKKY